jgi:putative endonuclease
MPPKGTIRLTGLLGEDLAAVHLRSAGYQIIEKNYRCPFGEVDIVARDGESIVFVEVKSRRSGKFGVPQLAVGAKKQEKLSKIALYYLKENRLHGRRARFDVVAVRILPEGNGIDLIKNAFDLCYGW